MTLEDIVLFAASLKDWQRRFLARALEEVPRLSDEELSYLQACIGRL